MQQTSYWLTPWQHYTSCLKNQVACCIVSKIRIPFLPQRLSGVRTVRNQQPHVHSGGMALNREACMPWPCVACTVNIHVPGGTPHLNFRVLKRVQYHQCLWGDCICAIIPICINLSCLTTPCDSRPFGQPLCVAVEDSYKHLCPQMGLDKASDKTRVL